MVTPTRRDGGAAAPTTAGFTTAGETTRFNISTKVVDISAEACVLRKNGAATMEHLRPSSTAVHTDVLESMCICKKERHTKFEMPSAYGLDVHASRGNLGKNTLIILARHVQEEASRSPQLILSISLGFTT